MEKVYMEAPRKQTNRQWRAEDVSPYDFRDDLPNNSYNNSKETDFDMDSLMEDMNALDSQFDMNMNDENEDDMYHNGNIDWQWNEDVSQSGNCRTLSMERKKVIEEENPKRITTIWTRITKQY